MPDTMQSGFQKAMAGATQAYKDNLRKNVDDATYRDIVRVAMQVLGQLPADVMIGTVAAGLMLAATSYAEGSSQAGRLIAPEGESTA